jgi:hypothetical protein
MFNTLTAMRSAGGASYTFAGNFDTPPSNEIELAEYLGIDGSFLGRPNVSADARIYPNIDRDNNDNLGNVGAASCGYIGFIPGSNPSNVTDPDFNKGTGNIQVNALGSGGLSFVRETATGTWPTTADGTQSFIMGGVFRIDDLGGPGANNVRSLFIRHTNTVADFKQGWRIYYSYSSGQIVGQLKTDYGVGNQFTVVAPGVYSVGDSIAVLMNLDVAAGKLKLVTSVPGSYAEVAWTDTGDFGNVFPDFAAGYDWTGMLGQMFMAEYSGAIDAQLDEQNMLNFLQYYDETLTI